VRRSFAALVGTLVAALALGATPAAADPSPDNPNKLAFTINCPGMAPFQVTVAGAVGFVQGQRLLAIRQATPDQGSLDLVECTATNPNIGTITVFLQFVQRS
jgi:hypothetical protein